MPIYLKSKLENDAEALRNYCMEKLGLLNPDIRMAKIKIQSLVKRDGYYMYLSGKTGKQIAMRNAVEMCLEQKWINYIKGMEKENGYEKATKEENELLYGILTEKHTKGIFACRPNPMGETLKMAKDKYMSLDLQEQCKVILEILNLSKIGIVSANLSILGGGKSAGTMKIAQNISDAKEFILINQSVTGVYESRINLLTV